jgi:hypothetical protein
MESAGKSLEEQLRDGLVAKRAEESYRMMQEPDYQRHSRECLVDIIRSVGVGLGHGKKVGKADKLEQDLSSVLYGMIFKNPGALRKISLDAARQHYFSRDEMKAHLEGLYVQAEQAGISPKVVARLREEGESKVVAVADIRARVFAGLLEMAQTQGLQYALTDEAESEAMRAVFPTREQYLASQEYAAQTVKDYFDRFQAMMLKERKIGKQMAGMIGGSKAAVDKFSDDVIREIVLRRADKIYGSTPKRK